MADNEETTTTTTVTAEQAARQETEKKGEVHIDESAEANQLKEQTVDERLDSAREEALANHAAEHANDEGDVNSRDKVEE